MALIEYLLTVVLVTASGALAPGPLFFATILNGAKGGAKSGFSVSIGHMLVELPLVVLLAVGLLTALNLPVVKIIIGLAGGVALIGFGSAQLLHTFSKKRSFIQPEKSRLLHNSILLGVTLSALNPFFILWWFTIGSKLILDALILASLAGVFIMYFAHVWMDYAWLTFIADLAKKGTSFFGTRAYRLILTVFGIVLVYFGIGFLTSIVGINIIP